MTLQTRNSHMNAQLDPVETAHALVSVLRQRSAETSELGRLPEETISEMDKGGLFDLLVPRTDGGLEVDLQTYMDVLVEIARGDGAVAWTLGILSGAPWLLAALFPPDVSQEILRTRGARIATVLSPRRIKARQLHGGYLIEKGEWSFNSGFFHAHWNLLGFPVQNEDGAVIDNLAALLPAEKCLALGDWDTFGLRGSGSTTIVVEQAFIPKDQTVSLASGLKGEYASTHLENHPLYRLPLMPFLSMKLLFPSLGMAKAALEFALSTSSRRAIPFTIYNRQDDAPITHLQFAEAATKIDTAETILQRNVKILGDMASRRTAVNHLTKARIMRDAGFVNQILWEAIDLLATACGGSMAQLDNPLGAVWRNAKVASLHGGLNTTTNFELFGRVQSGKSPQSWVLG
ncbi:acyl-CoA dehydrogenase family protein [Oryzifoliimicrobium ureilyticus]|uniref:acyl-CoA dehydrogenase family protein n=1 Tax=Oryzifoliimicrobium ureilyticus TaxID=3113724 RepID=UPI00307679EA